MTVPAPPTEVLPPAGASARPPAAPSGPPAVSARAVLTAVACLALVVVMIIALAEWVTRSEVERRLAEGMREALALPDGQRVDVAIDGLVLPHLITGIPGSAELSSSGLDVDGAGFDVAVSVADIAFDTVEDVGDLHVVGGELSFDADQATLAFLPEEARTMMRLGFRGAEMTLGMTVESGGQSSSVEVAVTPTLEDDTVVWTVASIRAGETTIAADEVAARLGPDAAALIVPMAVCVAEDLPPGIDLETVAVRDQHLVFALRQGPRENARVPGGSGEPCT